VKFYGSVGFVEIVEKRPGVKTTEPVEYQYAGDVLKRSLRYQATETVHDSITPSQQISILADPYARNHVGSMKYVKWMGTPWKISEISVEYPRLILTLGGPYNGATVRSSDTGA
jgi:hypothetical protein